MANNAASRFVDEIDLPTLGGRGLHQECRDAVGRLDITSLKNSGGSDLNKHDYTYNDAHQPEKQTFKEGNYVDCTYDDSGQLKTALGKHSTGVARAHEQRMYFYDAAGNLTNRNANGFVQHFAVDSVNQLTSSSRAGAYTMSGGTIGGATSVGITLNGVSQVDPGEQEHRYRREWTGRKLNLLFTFISGWSVEIDAESAELIAIGKIDGNFRHGKRRNAN